jgi:ABC-type multidrug transport system fused ATPase/permease subunit
MDDPHGLLHLISGLIGSRLGDDTPAWLHPALHVALIWAPLALGLLGALQLGRSIGAWLGRRVRLRVLPPPVVGLPERLRVFILRFSRRDQIALTGLGLLSMPILYAALELPKRIINNAIESGHFPVAGFGLTLSQTQYLLALSGLYLLVIFLNGAVKYGLNVYKGRVGERLLRRLRLTIYRRWRAGAGGGRRSEVIPLIAQEVEPIGGYAADAFALPVLQGGTLATILVFMFVQDPVLGAAAVSLLPVQIVLIPRLQRRVNRLARERARELRALGGELGQQAERGPQGVSPLRAVTSNFRRIERIRRRIHRSKYFIKALNNFLVALTPFFFYAIGGWLVIEGRLSLGALVAALGAYKDFTAPVKELFRFYQTSEDARIRYTDMLGWLGERAPRPEPVVRPRLVAERAA